MESIVRRLHENRRLDEVSKKKALTKITNDLKQILRDEEYQDKISIVSNSEEGCVDISFKGTEDKFSVYPKKHKISDANSNKTVKVSSIDGAYIKGTTVYDDEDNIIGEALVRLKATHSKSDYSDSIENAEYRFNSKLSDYRRLEKYIDNNVIHNVK